MDNFFDFYFYKSIESTNDKLKQIRENKLSKNIALLTQNQQKGRGRSKNSWYSKEGDLTCSFLINKSLPIDHIGKINIIFVNVLLNFFNSLGLEKITKYKWPNDILIMHKKISGLLIETSTKNKFIENFIVGIGINIISSPLTLKNKTTSLIELNKKIDPLDAFFQISTDTSRLFRNFDNLDFVRLSKNLSNYFYRSKENFNLIVNDKTMNCSFKKIDNNGELVVDTLEKTNQKISYGEII